MNKLLFALFLVLPILELGCDHGPKYAFDGEACSQDNDCFSDFCKTQFTPDPEVYFCNTEDATCPAVTFPKGKCTIECETHEDCGAPLGVCVAGDVDGRNFCIQGCFPDHFNEIEGYSEYFDDCREGYSCELFGIPGWGPVLYGCWPGYDYETTSQVSEQVSILEGPDYTSYIEWPPPKQ